MSVYWSEESDSGKRVEGYSVQSLGYKVGHSY